MCHQNSLLPKSYLAVRERTLSSWQSSDIRGVRGWAVGLPRIHSEQKCLYSVLETDSLFLFLPFLQRRTCLFFGGGFPFFVIYWYLCPVWSSPGSVKRLPLHMISFPPSSFLANTQLFKRLWLFFFLQVLWLLLNIYCNTKLWLHDVWLSLNSNLISWKMGSFIARLKYTRSGGLEGERTWVCWLLLFPLLRSLPGHGLVLYPPLYVLDCLFYPLELCSLHSDSRHYFRRQIIYNSTPLILFSALILCFHILLLSWIIFLIGAFIMEL